MIFYTWHVQVSQWYISFWFKRRHLSNKNSTMTYLALIAALVFWLTKNILTKWKKAVFKNYPSYRFWDKWINRDGRLVENGSRVRCSQIILHNRFSLFSQYLENYNMETLKSCSASDTAISLRNTNIQYQLHLQTCEKGAF